MHNRVFLDESTSKVKPVEVEKLIECIGTTRESDAVATFLNSIDYYRLIDPAHSHIEDPSAASNGTVETTGDEYRIPFVVRYKDVIKTGCSEPARWEDAAVDMTLIIPRRNPAEFRVDYVPWNISGDCY